MSRVAVRVPGVRTVRVVVSHALLLGGSPIASLARGNLSGRKYGEARANRRGVPIRKILNATSGTSVSSSTRVAGVGAARRVRGAGPLTLVRGLSVSGTSFAMTLDFSRLPFSVLVGYLVFGELIDGWTAPSSFSPPRPSSPTVRRSSRAPAPEPRRRSGRTRRSDFASFARRAGVVRFR